MVDFRRTQQSVRRPPKHFARGVALNAPFLPLTNPHEGLPFKAALSNPSDENGVGISRRRGAAGTESTKMVLNRKSTTTRRLAVITNGWPLRLDNTQYLATGMVPLRISGGGQGAARRIATTRIVIIFLNEMFSL